jgi:hypothetical protein
MSYDMRALKVLPSLLCRRHQGSLPMEFQELQAELRRMGEAAIGMAAINTVLQMRQGKIDVHPDVAARLEALVGVLLPGGPDGLDAGQSAAAVESITLMLEETRDLLENAGRPPAWSISNPAMLRAQGQASRIVARRIISLAADRPVFAENLKGRFLDVGTGIAAIPMALAPHFPALQMVGIDIWQPSLALARADLAASPYAEQITIRAQNVLQLDEIAAYTVAWLPTPFMRHDVVRGALDRLAAALVPGGHIIIGMYGSAPSPVAAAIAALRLTRGGGEAWEGSALEAELSARGFIDIEFIAGPPVSVVLARRS